MLCIISIDFNLNTKTIDFWVNRAGLSRLEYGPLWGAASLQNFGA
jgi:hypothetical protein